MDKHELTKKIKHKAYELGFAKVGITAADDFEEYAKVFKSRIDDYRFLVGDAIDPLKGSYPKAYMPEAKSVVCLVWDFSTTIYPEKLTDSFGRAYLSRSYLPKKNSVHGSRLRLFEEYMESLGVHAAHGIHLPERNACARAGVITYGRNNFAYAEGCGSYIILKAFLVDAELEYDESTVRQECPENCRICIDVCPTGAIGENGDLKPQKCILYNQMRAGFDPELRDKVGQSIHGCDVCQSNCPRNKKLAGNAVKREPFLDMLAAEFDLEKVLLLDQDYYERIIYPIAYNYIRKLELFQRNAAIALGNTKDASHVSALIQALETCKPVVQGCAAWALGEIGGETAKDALTKARDAGRYDERVQKEIVQALQKIA